MLAPYLNGKAGDLAYEAQGYGFGAQDLTQYLGAVMNGLIE
jgi:NAD(P)H-hydrate epimerase